MTGNSAALLVVQDRDRRLLRALGSLRVIDREQARVLGPFASLTRVNTRLLALVNAGLLARLAVGTVNGGHKFLYARTASGAKVVGEAHQQPPWNSNSPIIAGQPLLEHQLRLNQLYLALSMAPNEVFRLTDWQTFKQPPLAAAPGLIPDAYLVLANEITSRPMFVEMDLATEPLRTWARKAERYVSAAHCGEFPEKFVYEQFGVAIILPSLGRLETVRKTVAGVTTKLFWLTTFEAMERSVIGTKVWWRPTGEHPVQILN